MERRGASWGNMGHPFALFPMVRNWATNSYVRQQMHNKCKTKRAIRQQKKERRFLVML